jgi:hypothetical protein
MSSSDRISGEEIDRISSEELDEKITELSEVRDTLNNSLAVLHMVTHQMIAAREGDEDDEVKILKTVELVVETCEEKLDYIINEFMDYDLPGLRLGDSSEEEAEGRFIISNGRGNGTWDGVTFVEGDKSQWRTFFVLSEAVAEAEMLIKRFSDKDIYVINMDGGRTVWPESAAKADAEERQ